MMASLLPALPGLDPDLQTHVQCIRGRPWLMHPLLDAMPLDGKDLAAVNELFRRRSARALSYANEGDWFGFIMCHDRPLAFETFLQIASRVPDDDYWRILRQLILVGCDTTLDTPTLAQLLAADRPGRERLMTIRERNALARLPDPLKVFGLSNGGDQAGLFWWLERCDAKAVALSQRHGSSEQRIVGGTVAHSDIVAYLPELRGDGVILADSIRVDAFRQPTDLGISSL